MSTQLIPQTFFISLRKERGRPRSARPDSIRQIVNPARANIWQPSLLPPPSSRPPSGGGGGGNHQTKGLRLPTSSLGRRRRQFFPTDTHPGFADNVAARETTRNVLFFSFSLSKVWRRVPSPVSVRKKKNVLTLHLPYLTFKLACRLVFAFLFPHFIFAKWR